MIAPFALRERVVGDDGLATAPFRAYYDDLRAIQSAAARAIRLADAEFARQKYPDSAHHESYDLVELEYLYGVVDLLSRVAGCGTLTAELLGEVRNYLASPICGCDRRETRMQNKRLAAASATTAEAEELQRSYDEYRAARGT